MTRYLGLLTGLAVLTSTYVGNAQTPDPCALLTVAELQPAFPGAKLGRTIRTLEKEGILSCEWVSSTGRVVLVAGADSADDTPIDEAKTLMAAFVDPLRADAERHVRFETLPGVGDKAVALLERQDQAKGITQNGVLLVVRRGQRQVSLMAVPPGDLMRRERADALKIVAELGKAIARRLG
jgi:hypothetical protein